MSNVYKIDKKLMWRYLLKKALYDTLFMLIPLSIIFLIIAIGTDFDTAFLLVLKVSFGIILFLLGIFVFSLLSINAPIALRFAIEHNRFTKFFSSSNLNLLNKYSFRKIERRTGQKQLNSIYFDDIKSIDIGRFAIVIKSKDDHIFNPNGKIVVPREIEDFKDFQQFLQSHPATKDRISG